MQLHKLMLMSIGLVALFVASALGSFYHPEPYSSNQRHIELAANVPIGWAGGLSQDGSFELLGTWWAMGQDSSGKAYGMMPDHVKTALQPGWTYVFGFGSNFYTDPGTTFQPDEFFSPAGGGSSEVGSVTDQALFSFDMLPGLTFAERATSESPLGSRVLFAGYGGSGAVGGVSDLTGDRRAFYGLTSTVLSYPDMRSQVFYRTNHSKFDPDGGIAWHGDSGSIVGEWLDGKFNAYGMVTSASGNSYGAANWYIPAQEFAWAYDKIASAPEPITASLLLLALPLLSRRKAL